MKVYLDLRSKRKYFITTPSELFDLFQAPMSFVIDEIKPNLA